MAPEKRSRRAVDGADSDDEDIDLEDASPNSRQGSGRKRARISDVVTERARESTPEYDEALNNEEPPSNPKRADSPPRTQYEILRDQEYQHLENEAEDDLRATQKLSINTRNEVQTEENRAASNGIIETVTCINFMCHTRLHVELGPLLNFIVGENGSGKSAVLTAITLCLGAKASSTNRGGSLKSFIKEGQEQSSIQVKLKNQGEGAYQPDAYGDSIIVERHFNKNGASGFKLKNALGRIISTKRRDVDELVEYFCLQMDNPLNVLSQDNARQFLNASTPNVKYKFFVQGVQLETLDNDYKLISQTVDNIDEKLRVATEYVKRLEREHNEAKRLLDTLKKHDGLREKRRLYRNQLIWSQVVDQERKVDKAKEAIAMAEQRIARAEQAIQEKSQIHQLAEEAVKKETEAIESMKSEVETLEENERTAREAYLAAKAELTTLHQEERTARDRFQTAKKDVKKYENLIADEERRLAEMTGDSRAKKEAEFEAAKDEVKRIEAEQQQSRSTESRLQEDLQAAKAEAAKIRPLHERKKGEVQATERHIHELQKNRGEGWSGFDRNVRTLLNMIEKEGGFKRKPIGPIGRHVQLLKPEWSSIIEKVLGNTPDAFIVTNHPDSNRLRNMMKRAGVQKNNILISTGRTLDLSGKEPDPRFDTILRVLQIDDDLVRDQLIIHHKIEQAILIKSRKEAEEVMFGERPRNATFCLAFHDRKKGEGISLMVNARGDQSLDPVKPYKGGLPRLQTDDESQIQHQKAILADLQGEMREIRSRLDGTSRTVSEIEDALKAEAVKFKRLERECRLARADVQKLETEVDSFEGGDLELTNLKEMLKAAETRADHEGKEYGEMGARKPDVNAKVESLQREMKAESKNLSDFNARLDEAKRRAQNKDASMALALSAKNEAYEQLDQAKVAKGLAEHDAKSCEEAAKALEEQAVKNAGERVYIAPDATPKSIEIKYRGLKTKLAEIAKRLGASEEVITDRAEKAQLSYDTAKRDHDDQLRLQYELRETLNERLRRWRSFQRYLSARTRVNFNYLLSERGFRGTMKIDHRNRKLALQVEPDETSRGGRGRETKTLSGGEKSFASICMLLAIWEAMGSSIRCLDEFDVFMDNINRAISTNMLISAARRSTRRQYILITPNAIEGRASLAKDVKIIRLSDPRQRTIPQMQRNMN